MCVVFKASLGAVLIKGITGCGLEGIIGCGFEGIIGCVLGVVLRGSLLAVSRRCGLGVKGRCVLELITGCSPVGEATDVIGRGSMGVL